VKIGPVDTEIALLIVKKIKKNKLMQAKYIALPASLPSGVTKKLENAWQSLTYSPLSNTCEKNLLTDHLSA